MASYERPAFNPDSFLSTYGGDAIAKFKANHVIYSRGNSADGVFYVQAGRVKLSVISEQGKEAVITVLEPGNLFGEDSLAARPLRITTAVTVTDCVLAKLNNQSVNRARRESGPFSDFLISFLLSENARLKEHLLNILLQD